ncbi:MAG: DMT family transporter [Proteobacteria bacterium]|nr:DMT family transporter [Pseudomonadota bacterium]
MTKDHIDSKGFTAIVILAILWGINYSAIKFSNTGLSPIFTTFLRSLIASFLGIIYCIVVKEPLFHRGILLFHGFIVGLLFGLEFVCLYLGMLYTDAARAAIFVYLSPFIVALGAHFFLKERLNLLKIVGLVLAFIGVYLVFKDKPHTSGKLMLLGDLLEIIAAIFWGATTLYIKKYLAKEVRPINTFLYQFVFSIPIMFACAYFIEDKWIFNLNVYVWASVAYQSVIVAFASYLVWFMLIHTYPVAKLSVFTFLAPVFGVLFGAVILKEKLTTGLIMGLVCVSIGIFCNNYTKK